MAVKLFACFIEYYTKIEKKKTGRSFGSSRQRFSAFVGTIVIIITLILLKHKKTSTAKHRKTKQDEKLFMTMNRNNRSKTSDELIYCKWTLMNKMHFTNRSPKKCRFVSVWCINSCLDVLVFGKQERVWLMFKRISMFGLSWNNETWQKSAYTSKFSFCKFTGANNTSVLHALFDSCQLVYSHSILCNTSFDWLSHHWLFI